MGSPAMCQPSTAGYLNVREQKRILSNGRGNALSLIHSILALKEKEFKILETNVYGYIHSHHKQTCYAMPSLLCQVVLSYSISCTAFLGVAHRRYEIPHTVQT